MDNNGPANSRGHDHTNSKWQWDPVHFVNIQAEQLDGELTAENGDGDRQE